jgi:hypothetical protein
LTAPPNGPWPPPQPQITPPPANRGRQWLSLAVMVTLLAGFAGGGAWLSSRKHAGPSYPKQWDGRVANLVSFVERTRGLQFKHPVAVDFVPESAFKHKVTTDEDELTAEDKTDLEDSVAFMRALGLVEGNVDLFDAMNQQQSEGVLAFYSPETKSITIRGTTLDVATRVTVVHEMTHALQDQHFDLTAMRKLDHHDESGAITALVEGDAVAVENAYVDSLTKAEKREYRRENARAADDADYDGVPPVVQIMFGAPYQFGPALVSVLKAEGGQDAIDGAFRNPPTATEHIFNPASYIDHDEPEHVDRPTVPHGAKKTDDGEFEPLGWFIMLSERVDAHEALRVADGWGGDEYVAYRTDRGQLCTRIRYRGETARDTDAMHDAINTWIDALPTRFASVKDEGSTLLFASCDPGEAAQVATGKSLDAISLPSSRSEILRELLESDAPIDAASCVANGIVDEATVKQLKDPSGAAFTSPEGQQHIQDIVVACRDRS